MIFQMDRPINTPFVDTGERIIPTKENEVSVVFSRHLFAYRYASQYVVDKVVLDIGCGTGYGCHLLAGQAKHVTGIDYNISAIEYCKTNYQDSNIEFIHADASNLSSMNLFDVAVSFQVIEHIADVDNFIIQIKKRVTPGGIILISTPNSKTGTAEVSDNVFHVNEMNYTEFDTLMKKHFRKYEIYGIAYSSKNRLREFFLKSPLYHIGKLLRRGSKIKKLETHMTGMTEFIVIEDNVHEKGIDLLAVCTNYHLHYT